MFRKIFVVMFMLLAAQAHAGDYLRDPVEVEALLKGATLDGTYLRTNSDYRLVFREDGTLEDARESGARWWVTEQGQYCREWLNGPLAGNEACMDVALDGERVLLFSNGSRVAEGELQR